MIPDWLHLLSILSLGVAAVSAIWIAIDEARDPQHMWIMNLVWPLIALSFGPVAVAVYYAYGKMKAQSRMQDMDMSGGMDMSDMPQAPYPVMVAKGSSHCGAGCTLGDILAEWLAFLVPTVAVWFGWKSIFADKIFAVWILDFLFAFGIGVMFQYFTIKPMRGLSVGEGIKAAVKADVLSLTSWQVGMYGFMAIAHFWIFGQVLGVPLEVPTVEFWFMMQIAMICGFITSYPVNWILISKGIKEKM